MGDDYQGLDPANRGGCLFAAAAGVLAFVLDFVRIFGDPAPGTEGLWWRHIPFPVPTLLVATAAFLISRALIRRGGSDGS